MMTEEQARAAVDEIFALYETYGAADYIGEPVSQLEHMSQTATLALEEGYDDEVVLAAFFHDIGHLCVGDKSELGPLGHTHHEEAGARYLLTKGFPQRVASLVKSHVLAKRYLTFKYPDYYNHLSDASRQTLLMQGGPMTATEAAAFEEHPLFDLSLLMRKWDDLAKETNQPPINLGDLKSKALRQLLRAPAVTSEVPVSPEMP
jgi:phosphonate degradation associated HDIG domain protein